MEGIRRDWPSAGEAVVGVFGREGLSSALAATHRAGFGPHARVLDGARGELAGQFRRAGLPLPPDLDGAGGDAVLIVVTAPGRAAAAAETLVRAGALAVHRVSRGGASPSIATAPPTPAPVDVVEVGGDGAVIA